MMRRAGLALLLLVAGSSVAGAADDAAIAKAWRALNPGRRDPPACANNPDPVRRLVEDLDKEPGVETALASLRYGVVLIAADGRALAAYSLGCGEHPDYPIERQPQVLDLSSLRATGRAPNDLVLRVRRTGHAGEMIDWTIFHRWESYLEPALSLDLVIATPWVNLRREVKVRSPAGVLEVHTPAVYFGDLPATASDDVALYDLDPSGKFVLRGSGADSRRR